MLGAEGEERERLEEEEEPLLVSTMMVFVREGRG